MNTKMFLSRYEAEIYVILRIVTGLLFLWHGSQKLFNYPPAEVVHHSLTGYIAGTVEFFGGILVMVGLFTRWAAFISSGVMAYAYWSVHGIHGVLPLMNLGELAVIYCFLFLFISARGSGAFSLDSLLRKK